MANLQFTDLQSEVYDHTGMDSADTGNQTRVKRWINYSQQDIQARWPWPWALGRETITMNPDYTTGTVSVNKGSATVTGSGTTFAAGVGNGQFFIQFSTANDWYQIASYSSGTSIAMSTNYQLANATTLTYIIRQFFYSLSSTADEIIDIRNWNTPIKLIQVDLRTIDTLNPLVQSTNAPYGYMMFGYDSSNNLQISPYPFTTDARLFEIRTKKRPVDMVNTTDLPSIPNKYSHVIAWGAIAVGMAYLRRMDVAGEWSQKFETRISQMMKEYRESEDFQPILGSIDSVARSRWIQFPSQYPTVSGGY